MFCLVFGHDWRRIPRLLLWEYVTSRLTSRRSQPPLARSVPLSRFTSPVGGGSAFFVRRHSRAMRKLTFIVLLILTTLAAIAAARFWALLPLGTMLAYIHPPDWTDADLVRHIWHYRLVQPEWVSSPPQYSYTRWMMAETLARLSVVLICWLVSITFIIRRYLRSRKKLTPNKSPEPTAVGHRSSAVAARVVSRRWLSFFR